MFKKRWMRWETVALTVIMLLCCGTSGLAEETTEPQLAPPVGSVERNVLVDGEPLTVSLDAVVEGETYEIQVYEEHPEREDIQIASFDVILEEYQYIFTVDPAMLKPYHSYLVRFIARKQGWTDGVSEIRVFVIPNIGSTDGMHKIRLKVNGDSTKERNDIWSGDTATVSISSTINLTAVRLYTRDGWVYWWGRDSYEQRFCFDEGDQILYALGTTTEIDFDALEKNGWQQEADGETRDFNWETDVFWEYRTNPVLLHVRTRQQTPAARLIHDRTAVAPNEDFMIGVERPEGADSYSVTIERADGEILFDSDGELSENETFTVPAGSVPDGERFRVSVTMRAEDKTDTEVHLEVLVSRYARAGAFDFVTPEDLKTVEAEAFQGTAEESVRITEQVEAIGDRAFAGSALHRISIPAGTAQISESAFEECGPVVIFCPAGSPAQDWAERHEGVYYVLTEQVGVDNPPFR